MKKIQRNFSVKLTRENKYAPPSEKDARVTTTDLLSAYSLIKQINKGWKFDFKDINECNIDWEVVETETFKQEKKFVEEKKAEFEKLGITV